MLFSIASLATRGKVFRTNYRYLTATSLNMDLSAFIIPLNSNISANKLVTPVNGPTPITFSNNVAYFGDFSDASVGFVINGPPNAGDWSWLSNSYTGTLDSPPTEFEGDFTMEVEIDPIGLPLTTASSWIFNTKSNFTFGSTPGDYIFGINGSQLFFSKVSETLATVNHNYFDLFGNTSYGYTLETINPPTSVFSSTYSVFKMTNNGGMIALQYEAYTGLLYIYNPYTYSWTLADGPAWWIGAGISSDGTKIAATIHHQPQAIRLSVDSGSTWSSLVLPDIEYYQPYNLYMSGNGSVILFNTIQHSVNSKLYAGTLSGTNVTWSPGFVYSQAAAIADASLTSSGSTIVAITNNTLFLTQNTGSSWTNKTPSGVVGNMTGVVVSENGNILAVASYYGYIYTSSNAGVSWTPRDSIRKWKGISMSSDGTKLAAFVENSYIYISRDSGVTWSEIPDSINDWQGIDMPSDGSLIRAIKTNGTVISISSTPLGKGFKHVFIGRKDNVWWIGCNGVATSSTTSGNFNLSFTGPLQVGYHQFYGQNQFRGYMRNLIITKGSCKYYNSSYEPSIKNGLYINDGFYIAGLLRPTYTTTTPIPSINSQLYYTVANGTPTAVNGLYSHGYYTSGIRNTTYTNTTPAAAIDSLAYYTVANGTPTAVDGLYSYGYYVSGKLRANYTNTNPTVAIDNQLYYTGAMGVLTAANGVYSHGYYTNGTRSTTYTTTAAVYASDTAKFYSFSNGNPTLANGTIGGIPYSDGVVSYGARFWGGDGGATLSNPGTDFSLGTGNFTIEAWVVVAQQGGFVICTNSYAQMGGYSLDFSYFVNAGQVCVFRDVNGVSKLTTFSPNYQLNTKFHIALVRNSGIVRLYFNGTNVAADAGTSNLTDTSVAWNPSSGNTIGLGTQLYDGGGNLNPGDTWISDLRVVKGTAMYTANFTPPASMSSTGTATSIVAFKTPPITRDGSSKGKIIIPGGSYSPR